MSMTIPATLKTSLVAATVGLGTMFSTPAAEAFTLNFDSTAPFNSTNNPGTGASGTMDFNFSSASSNVVNLALTVTNTSSMSSKLVSFGFDLPIADLLGLGGTSVLGSATVGNFNVILGGELSPFTSPFELGYSISNNLSANGSPANGLSSGESQVFGFTLNFAGSTSATAVEDAFLTLLGRGAYTSADDHKNATSMMRFKAVGPNGDSDKVGGVLLPVNPPIDPPVEAVPEPATMLGLGMAGAGLLAAHKKKQSQA